MVQQYKINYQKGNYTFENPYIVVNPYEISPLTALVMFETEVPMEVSTKIVGKTDRTSISNTVSGYNTHHEIPIIGLYNGSNTIVLSAVDEQGNVIEKTLNISTEELPDEISSRITGIETAKTSELSDGLYVLKDYNRTIIDINGDVRGYYSISTLVDSGVDEQTSEGHIFISTGDNCILELDAMGFVYREMQMPYVADHDGMLIDKDKFLTIPMNLIDLNNGQTINKIAWGKIFNTTKGSAEVRFNGSAD